MSVVTWSSSVGPDEEALFVALDDQVAAVDDDLGAGVLALADVVDDAVA